MNTMLWPGWIAILFATLFTAAAGVFLLAMQYHRHGRLSWRRTLASVTVILYLFGLLSYTMLPLPATRGEFCDVRGMGGVQKSPLAFLPQLKDALLDSPGAILHDALLLQVALNVVLFLPLGVLAVRWARVGFIGAVLLGWLASVLIETTQYTGVFGIYDCAYRVTDIDDVIANTAGAAIGALLAYLPVFAWISGPNERAAAREYHRPRPVTRARRMLGMVFDLALVAVFAFILGTGGALVNKLAGDPLDTNALDVAAALLPPLLVIVLPALAPGRASLGQRCTWIFAADASGYPARIGSQALRTLLGGGGFTLLLGAAELAGDTGPGLGLRAAAFLLGAACLLAILFDASGRGFSARITGLHFADRRAEPGRGPTAGQGAGRNRQGAA
ncbi:VanZ family protein [Paeniglutamicibacter sp. NPDC091659]|uniref:VanZ family protein n=1 Tax=Paeniglutamicibacter sp. NPDC091659 TaxID=3364389 RepID=UPI003820F6A0